MLDLELLADDYAICRLAAGSALPSSIGPQAGAVVSVTWTAEETSVICPAALAGAVRQADPAATIETPWRCFRVVGPFDLALTGILDSLVRPLARARVNIFGFSTFDTDFVLVPAVRLAEASAALTAAGHRIAD
jgi:hypothetical protein